MKMNPEIKAKWVAALRSGNYPQGSGMLRQCGEFCCIGVLCDIVAPDKWMTPEEPGFAWSFGLDGNEDLPGSEHKELLGIDWNNTEVTIDGETNTLFNHNDCGKTFAQIADAIEEQL